MKMDQQKHKASCFLSIIYLFIVNMHTKSWFSQEEVMSDKQEVVSSNFTVNIVNPLSPHPTQTPGPMAGWQGVKPAIPLVHSGLYKSIFNIKNI